MSKFSLLMLIIAVLSGSPSKLSLLVLSVATMLLLLLWEDFSYRWSFRRWEHDC